MTILRTEQRIEIGRAALHFAGGYCGILQLRTNVSGKSALKMSIRARHNCCSVSYAMMDLIFIGATGAFFAIALAYVWGCIRL
jgi:hypothetical protein